MGILWDVFSQTERVAVQTGWAGDSYYPQTRCSDTKAASGTKSTPAASGQMPPKKNPA